MMMMVGSHDDDGRITWCQDTPLSLQFLLQHLHVLLLVPKVNECSEVLLAVL